MTAVGSFRDRGVSKVFLGVSQCTFQLVSVEGGGGRITFLRTGAEGTRWRGEKKLFEKLLSMSLILKDFSMNGQTQTDSTNIFVVCLLYTMDQL